MTTRKSFAETFGRSKVFLPVIHPISPALVVENVKVAVEAGADGVFLINQGMSAERTLWTARLVREIHPQLWIGINLLGFDPASVQKEFECSDNAHINGLWIDNGQIDERMSEQKAAYDFRCALDLSSWRGLYFGGVAFKGQREIPDSSLAQAAMVGASYIDVVTTSGVATGVPISMHKLQQLRQGLGKYPLALASGVTVDNILTYLPYVDAFLVASGIERRFGVLDFDLTKRLASAIHSYTACESAEGT